VELLVERAIRVGYRCRTGPTFDAPFAIGSSEHHSPVVQIVMALAADEHEVGDVGVAPGAPRHNVVGLAVIGGDPAADAASIPGDQRLPLGDGGGPVVAAHPDRLAGPVEDHRCDRRVTRDAFEDRLGERLAINDHRCERFSIRGGLTVDVINEVGLILGVGPAAARSIGEEEFYERVGAALRGRPLVVG
jgi:hypothetical protein